MRIFYSGNLSGESLPENLIPRMSPFVMLTYYEIVGKNSSTRRRFESMKDLQKKRKKERKKERS